MRRESGPVSTENTLKDWFIKMTAIEHGDNSELSLQQLVWDCTKGQQATALTAEQCQEIKRAVEQQVEVCVDMITSGDGVLTIDGLWGICDIELFTHPISDEGVLCLLPSEQDGVRSYEFDPPLEERHYETHVRRLHNRPEQDDLDRYTNNTRALLRRLVVGRHWAWLGQEEARELIMTVLKDAYRENKWKLFEMAADENDVPEYLIGIDEHEVNQGFANREAIEFTFERHPDFSGQVEPDFIYVELHPCAGAWLLYVRHRSGVLGADTILAGSEAAIAPKEKSFLDFCVTAEANTLELECGEYTPTW
jgi:hypothetical protein